MKTMTPQGDEARYATAATTPSAYPSKPSLALVTISGDAIITPEEKDYITALLEGHNGERISFRGDLDDAHKGTFMTAFSGSCTICVQHKSSDGLVYELKRSVIRSLRGGEQKQASIEESQVRLERLIPMMQKYQADQERQKKVLELREQMQRFIEDDELAQQKLSSAASDLKRDKEFNEFIVSQILGAEADAHKACFDFIITKNKEYLDKLNRIVKSKSFNDTLLLELVTNENDCIEATKAFDLDSFRNKYSDEIEILRTRHETSLEMEKQEAAESPDADVSLDLDEADIASSLDTDHEKLKLSVETMTSDWLKTYETMTSDGDKKIASSLFNKEVNGRILCPSPSFYLDVLKVEVMIERLWYPDIYEQRMQQEIRYEQYKRNLVTLTKKIDPVKYNKGKIIFKTTTLKELKTFYNQSELDIHRELRYDMPEIIKALSHYDCSGLEVHIAQTISDMLFGCDKVIYEVGDYCANKHTRSSNKLNLIIEDIFCQVIMIEVFKKTHGAIVTEALNKYRATTQYDDDEESSDAAAGGVLAAADSTDSEESLRETLDSRPPEPELASATTPDDAVECSGAASAVISEDLG